MAYYQAGQYPQGQQPPPAQAAYPQGQPPSQQQAGFPLQQQAGYPPQQAGYPPQQAGYPPQQAGYPLQQAGYPPQQQAGQAWGGAPTVDPNVAQWFQAVDRDRTGKISAQELQSALTNSNWSKFNMETCKLMIAMFDRDRSGQIDLPEFQALWNYIHQWKGMFDRFDVDRSGSIDCNELHNAFTQLGYRVAVDFSREAVMKFDVSATGRMNFDSFIHACVLIKQVTDRFRAKDPSGTGGIQVSYEEFLAAVVLNRI